MRKQKLNLAKNFAVTRAWGISRRFCTIIKNHDSENGQLDGKIKMMGTREEGGVFGARGGGEFDFKGAFAILKLSKAELKKGF